MPDLVNAVEQVSLAAGAWVHFDQRPPEPAVRHQPDSRCRLSGRHPMADCGRLGGVWVPPRDPWDNVT